MVLFSLLLFVGISLRTEAPTAEELEGIAWSRESWRRESEDLRGTPWYLNYRVLAAGIAVLTIAVIIPFI